MEQLNSVTLIGVVGTVKQAGTVASLNKKLARMTVATNVIYKSSDGYPVIETTWHNVVAFENGKGITAKTLEKLAKGSQVKIEGRIRQVRFTTESGEERTTLEILASSVEILNVEIFEYQKLNS